MVIPTLDMVIFLTTPSEVLMKRKAARQHKLNISVVDDLELMDELLDGLRQVLMEKLPPCHITINPDPENESCHNYLRDFLNVSQEINLFSNDFLGAAPRASRQKNHLPLMIFA